MSIHIYKCQTCENIFESIEKPGTKFAYCPKCKNIGIREGIELTSPPKLICGVGGFYKNSYQDRNYE